MTNQIYTGIGSRETPPKVLELMKLIAKWSAKDGWTLRSGGANGADSAFEEGCGLGLKEIYLPWKGFNGNLSPLFGVCPEAVAIAEQFHPNWAACKQGATTLHARNVYQVLGKTLDKPSNCVVCYTHKGEGKGGTGQAIRIAKAYNVKVFDLGKEDTFNKYRKHFEDREAGRRAKTYERV